MYYRNTYFLGTLRREQRSSLPVEIMYAPRGKSDPTEVKALQRGQFLWRFGNYGKYYLLLFVLHNLLFVSSLLPYYKGTATYNASH